MKKESLTSQTIKSSVWNLSYTIIQRVGGLVFTIILARILLPESFGLYSLVISIALIFMTFSYGGFDQTFIRYRKRNGFCNRICASNFYIQNL